MGLIKNSNRSVRVSLTLLHCAGFWANRQTGRWLALYYFYSVLSFILILGFLIGPQATDLYLSRGDLSAVISNLFVFLTNVVHSFKLANLFWRHEELQALIDDSNEALIAETGEEQRRAVKRCDEVTLKTQVVCYSITTVLMLLWLFRAMGQLILPARYPFDIESTPGREVVRIHQIVALVLASSMNLAKDTLVWSLMAQIQCRFTLLRMRLDRLTELPGDTDYLESEEGELMLWLRVRECVQRHQAVLRARDRLQACLSPYLFVHLTASVFVICASAYEIAYIPMDTFFASLLAYLLIIVYQSYNHCWRGNELIDESLGVGAAAFGGEWYRCSERARRALLLIAARASRPATITAGGLTVLSLESFVSMTIFVGKITYPPITTFTHFDFNKSMQYPAVTICRDTPYKFDVLEEYNLYAHPMYTSEWRDFPFRTVSLQELWDNATFRREEVFLQYSLNKDVDGVEIEEIMGFHHGRCFTLRPTVLVSSINRDTGYSIMLQNDPYYLSLPIISYNPPGYHVFIHSIKERFAESYLMYTNQLDYLYVTVGEQVDVKLKVDHYIKVSASNDVCNDETDYSSVVCGEKIFWENIIDKIGCSGPWMRSKVAPCDNFTTVEALIAEYNSRYQEGGPGFPECPNRCDSLLYDAFVNSRRSSITWTLENGVWTQKAEGHVLQTQIFLRFNSMILTVYEESRSYDWSLFISDLGSTMGFILGISVIGMIMIIERMWNTMTKSEETKKPIDDESNDNTSASESTASTSGHRRLSVGEKGALA